MNSETQRALSPTVGRRSFLKMAAIAGAFGATSSFAGENVTRAATEEEVKNPFPGSKKVKTICTSCSVGCGVIAEVQNGVWVRQEVAQDRSRHTRSHQKFPESEEVLSKWCHRTDVDQRADYRLTQSGLLLHHPHQLLWPGYFSTPEVWPP